MIGTSERSNMNWQKYGKLFKLGLLLVTALTLIGFQSVAGSVIRSDSGNVNISNLHIIDDDLYVFAQALDADGEIDGDLVCIAYKQVVRGRVTKSANLFGRYITNRGVIEGSFRAFGEMIDIDGTINGSALLAGSEITISQASQIDRDLHATGGKIVVDGRVGGKVVLRAKEIVIGGHIESDLDIKASKIIIMSSATINGNITYLSETEDDLIIEPGSDVRGDILWRERIKEDSDSGIKSIAVNIASTLAAFLFGLVVVRLFRPYAEESFKQLKNGFVASFGAGLLGLIAFAICLIILVIAIMFLFSGSVLLSSETEIILGLILVIFSTLALPLTAFVGVTGGIIFYSGTIVTAFVLGYLLIAMIKKEPQPLKTGSLLLGLVILLMLSNIPWLGTVIYCVAVISGAGAILLGIRHCRKCRNEAIAQTETVSNIDSENN